MIHYENNIMKSHLLLVNLNLNWNLESKNSLCAIAELPVGKMQLVKGTEFSPGTQQWYRL